MFEQLLTIDATAVTKVSGLLQFFVVVTLCAGALSLVYYRISPNESDGLEFASTIFILTVSIGLLVSIIKQAPAISFGLFGAMSIVRFRAQIKRTQRMTFVLMSAAIGVCCGAGEYVTTIFGTIVLSGLSLAAFSFMRQAPGAGAKSQAAAVLARAADTWSLDFLPAAAGDGGRWRILMIVNESTRQALALSADPAFSGTGVIDELDRLVALHGKPGSLMSDSWPEFGSRAARDWKKSKGIDWQIGPLSPAHQPPFTICALSKSVRDECLGRAEQTLDDDFKRLLEVCRNRFNERSRAAVVRLEPAIEPQIYAGGAQSSASPSPAGSATILTAAE